MIAGEGKGEGASKYWIVDFGPPGEAAPYVELMQAVAPYAAIKGLTISMKPHGVLLTAADPRATTWLFGFEFDSSVRASVT